MNYGISKRMSGMKPSIIREILKQMSDPTLISFAGGNPSPETFPASEIQKSSAALLQNHANDVLQYSVSEGVPQVVEGIKEFLNRRSSEQLVKENDELIILSGSQQAVEFAAKCLCNEGDIIASESPAFLGAYNAFFSYGANIKGIEMQEDGVCLKQLEQVLSAKKKPKFFYTVPNFQNPTGYTTSLEKREKIYDLCVKYGVPILEDDPYGELRFEGERVPPIKSFDDSGAVIYTGSFSKIMCPGMRLAYCVCTKELARHFVIAKQVNDVHTNVWAQRVCLDILQNVNMNEHIKKTVEIYAKKAEFMVKNLNDKCPELKFAKPLGGMFIFAHLPLNIDVDAFVNECLKQKLAIVPGYAFLANSDEKSNAIRLNFSTASLEQIEKGTDIMASVLKKML